MRQVSRSWPDSWRSNRTDRASSSELDHSDYEDYRKSAFGGSAVNMSPRSLNYSEFDGSSATPSDVFPGRASGIPASLQSWISRPNSIEYSTLQFIQNPPYLKDICIFGVTNLFHHSRIQ
ncbi:hypothetical protein B0T22DRAFT_521653 [Podospora appendiculata]|uniref:Uncharacterized protein n=1 Tax=Podospora appendiculata TaxID=314037 RepID=A0AAE0X0Y8_9PEZI|nr:hypothetical protein B0T22DRAFT_521653 [Podospora appendiculata]